jgi:thiamine-phosphate pyrophosphorylase
MPTDAPRLYLITPPVSDLAAAAPLLDAALDAADVACVLLRVRVPDEGAAKRLVRGLVGSATARDVALLLDGDAKLAVRAGADGVHVRVAGEALREALESLKPERIVGAGELRLRDDAMEAGEAGVDYVMFGEPSVEGVQPSFSETLERTRWWAEIFNIPCVAFATSVAQIGPLASAGADFVAVGEWIWEDPRGIATAMREAQSALSAGAKPEGSAQS